MNNFYCGETKVFVKGKGWTEIGEINPGDEILNVDFEDNRRGFFAPVVRVQAKTSNGCIYVGNRRYDPACEVLIDKCGEPVTYKWEEILKMYENDERWMDKIDPTFKMPDEAYAAWKLMSVYGSCNYKTDSSINSRMVSQLNNLLLGFIVSFYKNITILPADDEECAIRFSIPRDSIMASNVIKWLEMYSITYNENRSMTCNVISVYDADIKNFLKTFFVKYPFVDGCYQGNGNIIDYCNDWIVKRIVEMYSYNDIPSFECSGICRPIACSDYSVTCHPDVLDGDMEWTSMIESVLGAMCVTHGVTVTHLLYAHDDKVQPWFSNYPTASFFTRDDSTPSVFPEDESVYYALMTQAPHIMVMDNYFSDGSLARIAPVG